MIRLLEMAELHSHSGRRVWTLRSRANPDDLAHTLDGLAVAQHQLEAEKRANRSGALALDEHAARREVRRLALLRWLLGVELEPNSCPHRGSGMFPKMVVGEVGPYHSPGMLADRFRNPIRGNWPLPGRIQSSCSIRAPAMAANPRTPSLAISSRPQRAGGGKFPDAWFLPSPDSTGQAETEEILRSS